MPSEWPDTQIGGFSFFWMDRIVDLLTLHAWPAALELCLNDAHLTRAFSPGHIAAFLLPEEHFSTALGAALKHPSHQRKAQEM